MQVTYRMALEAGLIAAEAVPPFCLDRAVRCSCDFDWGHDPACHLALIRQLGDTHEVKACEKCHGRGTVINSAFIWDEVACEACHATGVVLVKKEIKAASPPSPA